MRSLARDLAMRMSRMDASEMRYAELNSVAKGRDIKVRNERECDLASLTIVPAAFQKRGRRASQARSILQSAHLPWLVSIPRLDGVRSI